MSKMHTRKQDQTQ